MEGGLVREVAEQELEVLEVAEQELEVLGVTV
jgi:hypothetical protein